MAANGLAGTAAVAYVFSCIRHGLVGMSARCPGFAVWVYPPAAKKIFETRFSPRLGFYPFPFCIFLSKNRLVAFRILGENTTAADHYDQQSTDFKYSLQPKQQTN